MASISDIKQFAKDLDYDVPVGDDEEILNRIAEQLGFTDYKYPDDNDDLFSILNDEMNDQNNIDNNIDDLDDQVEYLEDDLNDYDDQVSNNQRKDSGSKNNNEDSTNIQNRVNDANEGKDDNGNSSLSNKQEQRNGDNQKKDGNNSNLDNKNNKNNSNTPNNGYDPAKGPVNPNNQQPKGGLPKNGINSSNSNSNGNESALKNGFNNSSKSNSSNGSNNSSPIGNGYGNRNPKNNSKSNSKKGNDVTDRAKSSFNNDTKARAGRKAERFGSGSPKKDGLGNKGSNGGKAKETLKNKTKNAVNSRKKKASKPVKDFAKKVTMKLLTNPYFWIIFGVIVFFFVIVLLVVLIVSDGSGATKGSGSNRKCSYSLNGVASSKLDVSNLQVELINCSGDKSNYEVLETIDFEKYVVGVAMAEIGSSSPDEAIKAQIVAARGFSLTRNKGMCPGDPDHCFYGYNVDTGKIRMRACEADQVYWNYKEDIYRKAEGPISKYSPEVTSSTGAVLWHPKLDESRIAEIEKLANEVIGDVLIDDNSNVVSTNYNSTTSNQFISLANEGKKYDEILAEVYGGGSINGATCDSVGSLDYGDYELNSDSTTIIGERLDTLLSRNGSSIEELSDLIANNVEDAGYGTRAGVVMAAVTLIGEVGKLGYRVPYYWGGGHYDGVVVGALGYWGSTECSTYANGKHYNRCGLDCSGFVPWAIKNGGFSMAQMLAGDFVNVNGAKRVSLRSGTAVLQPGDLLENSHHITLIVGVDEEAQQYIIAHASGLESGVLFSRVPFGSSDYYGVDMTGYYENSANVRSK